MLIPSLFGLFVAMSNVSVPLTAVHYDVNVKSFASHITINQTYRNVESTDLECVYGFPINDKAAIVGLIVTIGNRTLVSQFKKKDDAFKEYTNALSKNDGAYLLDRSDRSDDTFVLSVGRLPPGKECTVSISYVNTLDSITETKMRLTIPTSLYPRYNPTPLAPKGVVPPEKYQSTVHYKASLSAHIQAIDVILNVTSPTHALNVTRLGPKEASVTFAVELQPLDRDLMVDIDLKNNPESYVEVENIAAGKYTAMFVFVPHFKLGVETVVNTELFFVVDCSGSMNSEDKIGDARRAMQIFLRSIPEGSYFNFYRFGSNYKTLFNESQLYTADSFAQAKAYADSTKANLGGTEILKPLQKIYSTPPRSGFSRQIFLLTDGEVSNTADVVAIVRANAANTRLFSFGLGQSPSRSLVNGVAAAGNGKAEFIKHGQELDSIIARQLNRALQPAVTDATVTWNGLKNVQQVPTNLPAIFKGDRQLIYAFFELDETLRSEPYIEFQRGGVRAKVPLIIPPSKVKSDGQPFLDKLAARELIKQVENSAAPPAVYGYHGSLQQNRAPLITNEEIKAKVTNLSLTYGVLSRYVSLVAIEQRSQAERANASEKMELREVPVQVAETKAAAPKRPYYRPFHHFGPPFRHYIWNSGGISRHRLRSGVKLVATSNMESAGISESSSSYTAPQAATHPSSPLSQLLALQQWNGVWKFSAELERVMNISQVEAEKAASSVRGGLSDDVVSTILVQAFIEKKYPAKADVWQAIVAKAATFLAKQSDMDDVVRVRAVMLSLIKSK